MIHERPKIIVITPVRNEAWVLEAFLTHCSSWADRIIIADQHSTDGSREIAAAFPKVTLIDNPHEEWIENEVRTLLIEEAWRTEGEKIIFALDADEFLSKGFSESDGWHRLLESEPNEVFCLRWFNLYGDFCHGEVNGGAEWVGRFCSDLNLGEEYHRIEHHAVHCMRVPCLEEERCRYTNIEDIRFVHLGGLDRRRTRNKLDFYQVVNHDKNPHKTSAITLYREYTRQCHYEAPSLPEPVAIEDASGNDLTPLVRTSDHGQHYIDEMTSIFKREGYRKFAALCIWDNPDLRAAGIDYRTPMAIRLMHSYLRHSQKCSDTPLVRFVDKILKRLF